MGHTRRQHCFYWQGLQTYFPYFCPFCVFFVFLEISYTGDAEAGSDYNQVTEHIIPPNSASSEFDLVIVEDDVVESDEKAILELFNIQHPFTSRTSGAVVVFPIPSSATQTVTIVNDDTGDPKVVFALILTD